MTLCPVPELQEVSPVITSSHQKDGQLPKSVLKFDFKPHCASVAVLIVDHLSSLSHKAYAGSFPSRFFFDA